MADAGAMHTVEDKVVIVTGAGRGVGLGIAKHLGRGGARVVLAEWKPDLLESATAELADLGVDVLGVRTDIMERDEIEAMVTATVERHGRVDGLVNNAQTFRPVAPMATVSADDVDVFYTSGVKGSLWAMQAVYPHMAAQGWGRIVNFASSMGITGGRGFGAYNASKEAIRALDAHRGARVGDRRHRGQLHRARRRRPPRRRGQEVRGLPGVRRELPDGPAGRSRDRHRAARVVPLLRRVPLPHRPHVHGRRRRVHVGVSDAPPPRPANPPLASAEGYRFVVPVTLAPEHIDGQGHLNNAAVARILNDLRVAYIGAGPGSRSGEYLRDPVHRRTVVVRELHVAYDREATIDDDLAGCVRVSARDGKAKIVEQRVLDVRRDLVVARAWVVQLFVEDGAVVEFPDFYWDAITTAEGRVIPREPRGDPVRFGPPT